MTTQTAPEGRGTWTRILSAAKMAWPAVFVFFVFDLSVDPNVSVLRSAIGQNNSDSPQLEIVSLDNLHDGLPAYDLSGESADSDHMWFGVEETVSRLSAANSGLAANLGGGWSGHFASILEGDVDNACWSAYEVNLRLSENGTEIFGPGSYVVDPSVCSSHEKPVVAFFNASGERHGDQVSLALVDDASQKTTLLFNGVIAGENIVGTFSLPNGAPASGATILTLLDPES